MRAATSSLAPTDLMGNPKSVNWVDIPWRRSAVQFMLDMHFGAQDGICPSVLDRLASNCQKLDDAIYNLDPETAAQDVKRPAGAPASHWWWFVGDKPSGTADMDTDSDWDDDMGALTQYCAGYDM